MKTYGFNTGANEMPTSGSIENTEINHENDSKYNPLNYARSIVRDISQSQEFIDTGYTNGFDMNDSSSLDYQYQLADMMLTYANDNAEFFRDNYSEDTLAAITMLGLAPYAVSQQSLLDASNGGAGLDFGTKNHAKDVVVQFNHSIYAFIKANPKSSLDETVTAISKTAADYSNLRYASVTMSTKRTVRGIRTEYGFEQVIEANDHIRLERATEAEDRMGIDCVVTDGTKTAYVDLKTSMRGVDEKTGYKGSGTKTFIKQSNGVFAYFPEIDDTAYNKGTFAVKKSSLKGLSGPVMDNVKQMLRSA